MVKILLDQNIQAPIVEWLQKNAGSNSEVTSTRMLNMQRMSDEAIFHFCQNQKMIIVTYDEDFQNPLVIPSMPGYGVVRLNVYPTGLAHTKEALMRLLKNYPVEAWEKASIVVDSNKIRYQKK